jgi:hypothetical protein
MSEQPNQEIVDQTPEVEQEETPVEETPVEETPVEEGQEGEGEQPEGEAEAETGEEGEGENWLAPFLAMEKDQLLNEVDQETLNQIRAELGDQAFIDQWKLTRDDYMRVIGADEQPEEGEDQGEEGDQAQETGAPNEEGLKTSHIINFQNQPAQVRTMTPGTGPIPILGGRTYISSPYRRVYQAPVVSRTVTTAPTTVVTAPRTTVYSGITRTAPITTSTIRTSPVRTSIISTAAPVRVSSPV